MGLSPMRMAGGIDRKVNFLGLYPQITNNTKQHRPKTVCSISKITALTRFLPPTKNQKQKKNRKILTALESELTNIDTSTRLWVERQKQNKTLDIASKRQI